MNNLKKIELESLRHNLKLARKKFGNDSIEVFKVIKKLKILNHGNSKDVENWEYYTLRCGSFNHLNL